MAYCYVLDKMNCSARMVEIALQKMAGVQKENQSRSLKQVKRNMNMLGKLESVSSNEKVRRWLNFDHYLRTATINHCTVGFSTSAHMTTNEEQGLFQPPTLMAIHRRRGFLLQPRQQSMP